MGNAGCQDFSLILGEKCYQYVGDGKDWTQAVNHCQSLGGKLAEPQSEGEFYIIKWILQQNGATTDAWIGGRLIDGKWTWDSSNDLVNYQPWIPGEPNESGDCMSLWKGRDYGLDDTKCSRSSSVSVCEGAKDNRLPTQ